MSNPSLEADVRLTLLEFLLEVNMAQTMARDAAHGQAGLASMKESIT